MQASFKPIIALTALLSLITHSLAPTAAQASEPWEGYDRPQLTLAAGLIQPLLLGGGNVELDLHYKRLIAGYSHGFALKLEGSTLTGEPKAQGLAARLPYSTGFGVGLRLLEWLDVRFEGKLHRFELREAANDAALFSYKTATLGAGIYARYRPLYHGLSPDFAPKWAQHITLSPSVRYWPKVWTSLEDDARSYDNQTTGQRERHEALGIGLAGSPFVVNISLGYMIEL